MLQSFRLICISLAALSGMALAATSSSQLKPAGQVHVGRIQFLGENQVAVHLIPDGATSLACKEALPIKLLNLSRPADAKQFERLVAKQGKAVSIPIRAKAQCSLAGAAAEDVEVDIPVE